MKKSVACGCVGVLVCFSAVCLHGGDAVGEVWCNGASGLDKMGVVKIDVGDDCNGHGGLFKDPEYGIEIIRVWADDVPLPAVVKRGIYEREEFEYLAEPTGTFQYAMHVCWMQSKIDVTTPQGEEARVFLLWTRRLPRRLVMDYYVRCPDGTRSALHRGARVGPYPLYGGHPLGDPMRERPRGRTPPRARTKVK